MTPLATYLLESRGRPFSFGADGPDCLTWVADWVVFAGGPDIAAPWRGTYLGVRQARRLLKAAGGPVGLARQACAGLEEIAAADARPGDIGIGVIAQTSWGRHAPVGLIRAGAFWAAFMAPIGSVLGEAEVSAAWRV